MTQVARLRADIAEEREKVVTGLVNLGYTVHVEEERPSTLFNWRPVKYFIIVTEQREEQA